MKKGRPCIEDKRDTEIRVRFNKKELTSLDSLCENYNMSKSELIRYLIFKESIFCEYSQKRVS